MHKLMKSRLAQPRSQGPWLHQGNTPSYFETLRTSQQKDVQLPRGWTTSNTHSLSLWLLSLLLSVDTWGFCTLATTDRQRDLLHRQDCCGSSGTHSPCPAQYKGVLNHDHRSQFRTLRVVVLATVFTPCKQILNVRGHSVQGKRNPKTTNLGKVTLMQQSSWDVCWHKDKQRYSRYRSLVTTATL